MSGSSTPKQPISDIVEQYNKDPQSLDEIVHKYVSISSENQNNQGNSFAVDQLKGKGNCWIIKVKNNLYFLIPQKKYKLNTHFLEILKNFYNYQEYTKGKTRDFELIEPAQVSWNGGTDWILQDEEHKGILDFGNQSPVNSPENSKEEIEEYLAQITEKDQQIEKLEREKISLKKDYQILQKEFKSLQYINLEDFKKDLKQEIIREIRDRNSQQPNIDLEALKQEILDEIGDRGSQQQNIDLETFKQEILEEVGDPIPQKPNIDLRYFKEKILKEIDERDIKFDNKLESLKEKLLGGTSDRIPQQPNINLESFKKEILQEISDRKNQQQNIDIESLKEEILNEVSDRDIKFDNKLESFKEKLLGEISDRIPQQQDIDVEAFKQEILDEIDSKWETFEKKINELVEQKLEEYYGKSFPDQNTPKYKVTDLRSLIDSYNSKFGFTSENIISIAATEDSIEKIRSGLKTPVIFTKVYNGSCWMIQDIQLQNDCFYIVPKVDLIINSRIYQTIEDIFICQNYNRRSSNKFQLIQPAIVKLISDSEDSEDKWELVETGKLNFS